MSQFTVKNKQVTVVGAGVSGVAAAALLVRQGAKVLVVDDLKKEIPSALSRMEVPCQLGVFRPADLFSSALVVISPGVPLSRLPLTRLRELSIPILGEMELASRFLSAPILAITGTNGKSTTTTLVGEILKGWGWNIFVGGNLGLPLSHAVGGHWDMVVVEASSFQLETIDLFRPRIAALLNVTPDHQDRYPDVLAYQQAKLRIFQNQSAKDHAVLNLDDPNCASPDLKGTVVHFSRGAIPDRGVYLRGETIVSNLWGEMEEIVPLSKLKVAGVHNVENVMAATAMALLCGCSAEGIAEALTRFSGLPHRMEWVRTVKGVAYINDSKGTNVGAVMKSLEGLEAAGILIAGGRDKGADFAPLDELIQKKVRHLILLGEAREKLSHLFSSRLPVTEASSMEEAVAIAACLARSGETVLLSPACASFDQFHDYQHRGEVFKKAVMALPE